VGGEKYLTVTGVSSIVGETTVLVPRDRVPVDGGQRRPRVYILARKILIRNTRIFKQARSLTAAGYDVTLIGILPAGGLEREQRDGYAIVRLPLDPLYARLPRRIRSRAVSARRFLLGIPARYQRRARRARRALRLARFSVRRRIRLARHRVWRRLYRSNRTVRLLVVGLNRRWRRVVYWVTESWWARVLVLPLGLLVRLLRRLAAVLSMPVRTAGDRRRARGHGMLYGLLRRLFRAEDRALSSVTEFLVARLTRVMRPFVMPLRSLEFYKVVYRAVTGELGAPDVVHANDLDTLLIARVLSRRYGTPLVYDAQELYIGVHTLSRWYRSLLTLQERILIRRADRIAVVNDSIKEVMEQKYKVSIDAVVLNCPPLIPEADRRTAPTLREELGLSNEQLVLLYSGALTPHRGLPNTIRALQYLEDTSLVLLGEGNLRDELERQAAAAGVADRVFFADFVHHLDVPELISAADFGVIPYEHVGINHYLCSPSKLFHYIMAGLPIVCSDFPYLRSVVLDNRIGAVFDPSDPASIAAAVKRLAVPPGLREACKQRLHEMRPHYCWEEQEKRFLGLYRSLPLPDEAPTAASPSPTR
jgi:glycosyltransferase involved in cell wall biosynthesis